MITKLLLLLACVSTVWSLPTTDGGDSQMKESRIDEMDKIRANISEIWSEINRIGEMVSTHVQDGHHHHDSHRHEDDYNQHSHHHHGNETQEMSAQIDDHSNHTHETEHHHDDQHYHQDHPHDDHVDDHHHHDEQRGYHHHHDEQIGHHHQHIGKSDHHHHQDEHYHRTNHTHETEHHHDDQHYHQDHPHDDQVDDHHYHDEQRGHHHQHVGESGHYHHHDEQGGPYHHHNEQRGHHHHHDDSHEVGSHDGDQVPHVHKPQSHEDNSDEEGSKGNNPNYGNKGYDHHKHHHRSFSHGRYSHHHFTNGHHHDSSSSWVINVPDRRNESGRSGEYSRTRGGMVFKTPGFGVEKLDLNSQSKENEIVQQAICEMKPNSEISGPKIKGDVLVFQKRYGEGPIYYNLKLKGFSVGKDERSRTHGFHIHEKALEGVGLCNSAGAHFNPLNQTHGSFTSKKRHLGDFGNIVVDKSGTLLEYEFTDSSNRLQDIVGKSMVVHELPDDFGKGGNLESLKTGNAGRRLACCTIYLSVDKSIRFNG